MSDKLNSFRLESELSKHSLRRDRVAAYKYIRNKCYQKGSLHIGANKFTLKENAKKIHKL